MTPNIYNPKIRHKKLLAGLLLAAVAVMFLVRGILYQNGTLEQMQTLSPEDLQERISGYEVQIAFSSADAEGNVSDRVFGGTILDGRKNSAGEDEFTLTIVTVPEAADSSGTLSVTLPDGTRADGSVLYADEDMDLAFVQCLCPSEIEAYYSRDILERLESGDAVYSLQDGVLASARLIAEGQTISGIGSDLLIADPENGDGSEAGQSAALSGSGLYGTSGNYLGMILQNTEGGQLACVSAVDIMKALNSQL